VRFQPTSSLKKGQGQNLPFARKQSVLYSLLAASLGSVVSILSATHLTALIDYSYLPNLAFALSNGVQIWEGVDHPIAPGSTIISLLFYNVFGWSSLSSLTLSALIGGSSSYLTFKIIVGAADFGGKSKETFLLLFISVQAAVFSPLLLIGFPFPDNFATLACLLSIWTIQKWLLAPRPVIIFISGMLATLPFFFKQNVGLFFLFSATVGIAILIKRCHPGIPGLRQKAFLFFLSGAFSVGVVFSTGLSAFGLGQPFVDQVLVGASLSKDVFLLSQLQPYLGPVGIVAFFLGALSAFNIPPLAKNLIWLASILVPSVLFLVPGTILGFFENVIDLLWVRERLGSEIIFLIIVPLVLGSSLIRAVLKKLTHADLTLFIVAGTLAGAYLSQGYTGSSYSFAPFLAVFIWLTGTVSFGTFPRHYGPVLASCAFAIFLVGQASDGTRLSFVDLSASGVHFDSQSPTSFIPVSDSQDRDYSRLRKLLAEEAGTIMFVPAEDPIAFLAPDSRQWGRCVQFMPNTCPSHLNLPEDLATNPPDIFIYKTNPQWKNYASAEIMAQHVSRAMLKCGTVTHELENYLVLENFSSESCLRAEMNAQSIR
jgi:hypothetical protein